jgi:hypothetical protein
LYDPIDFKPNVVLFFKTCPSMTNICTTIGLYAKSFDNQISRVFQVIFDLKWPDMSAPCRTCPTKIPLETLSLFLPDMFDP